MTFRPTDLVRVTLAAAASMLVVAALTGSARADATPVGPLPAGPTTTIAARPGSLVAIALPRKSVSSGLVWRLARRVDPDIARQVSEGEIGDAVVVVYRLTGRGAVTVRFALTRGDTSPTALAARSTRITSR